MQNNPVHPRPGSSGSAIPINSWYPPSVLGPASTQSSSSSDITTPLPRTNTGNSATSLQPTYSNASAINSFPMLKDKSKEELRKLLNDTETYRRFLHSCEDVQQLDHLRSDLQKNNVDLARKNLEKESEINQLKNQCMIIRTTELAAAQEKFEDLHKQEMELKNHLSLPALLSKLQASTNEVDEESENTHQQLLSGKLELSEFIQLYKKQRTLYHRRKLIRLAAVASG